MPPAPIRRRTRRCRIWRTWPAGSGWCSRDGISESSAMVTPADSAVRVEKAGAVTTVILHRPEVRNAVDPPTARRLLEAFQEFENDSSAHVAVLYGAGGTFCAGFDLKALTASAVPTGLAEYGDGPMGPTRLRLSKPVIAAVSVSRRGFGTSSGTLRCRWPAPGGGRGGSPTVPDGMGWRRIELASRHDRPRARPHRRLRRRQDRLDRDADPRRCGAGGGRPRHGGRPRADPGAAAGARGRGRGGDRCGLLAPPSGPHAERRAVPQRPLPRPLGDLPGRRLA